VDSLLARMLDWTATQRFLAGDAGEPCEVRVGDVVGEAVGEVELERR